jgi:hypothetical protein
MSATATEMTPHERATRLANMILTELVSDKPNLDLDSLTDKLRAVCDELGVDMKTALEAVSCQRCEADPSFADRLLRRASAVGN